MKAVIAVAALVAGIAGLLAAEAPELRRYMKIRSM
jgi:hypothetical protein